MSDGFHRRRAVGLEVLSDGSVHARVWAPNAKAVAVVLEADAVVARRHAR